MDKMELYGLLQNMIEILGEEQLLYELFSALSSDELEENLIYICDNYEMDFLYD